MFFALQWSFFSLNCIFVLLCTCWQQWSSYHLQGYLIRIIWFNGNLRQFQLQMYQNLLRNLQMLFHSASETEYTDKSKKNVLQIWTRELCTSTSVNIKNCREYIFSCELLYCVGLMVLRLVITSGVCKQVNLPDNTPDSIHFIKTASISYSSIKFLVHVQVIARKNNI